MAEYMGTTRDFDLIDKKRSLHIFVFMLKEGDVEAVEPLIKALKDRDSYVRLQAVKGLGIIKDRSTIGVLNHALTDNARNVRIEAEKALNNIKEKYPEEVPNFGEENIHDKSSKHNESLNDGGLKRDTLQEINRSLPLVVYNAMNFFKNDLHTQAVRIFTPLPSRKSLDSIDMPYEMKLFLEDFEIKAKLDGLFLHQVEFIKTYLDERPKNFIVTTGTGSGKSLCFWFWTIHQLLQNDKSTALLCFPTQALMWSQADRLIRISDKDSHITYDDPNTIYGGTIKIGKNIIPWTIWYGTSTDPMMRKHQMSESFSRARIRISTLDKLHWSLIGNDKRFLANLKCMVLDEAHIYHGVFGANVHYFLRRLYMACQILGNERPCIFLASATLASADLFAKSLLSISNTADIRQINDKIEPQIELVPISNVPNQLKDPPKNGLLRFVLLIKSSSEAPLASFMKNDDNLGLEVNAIYFSENKSKSRKIRRFLEKSSRSVEVYDADMTPKQRREAERYLNNKNTKGMTVIGTSAFELGIDIEGLDLCFLENIPPGRAEMFQRIGRVGRRIGRPGLVIMRVTDSPNDQNILENPLEEFLPSRTRAIPIPTHLEMVREKHAIAALKEWWGSMRDGNCDILRLSEAFKGYFDVNPGDPNELEARFIARYGNLVDTSMGHWIYKDFRPSTGDGTVPLKKGHIEIANINVVDIFRNAHPGAIYFDHNGKRYRVIDYELDEKNKKIKDLHSLMGIQVIPEDREVNTESSWDETFLLNQVMELPHNPDLPKIGLLNFGIWTSTRTWHGYTEYEEVESSWNPNGKSKSKDSKKIRISRYIDRNQMTQEISTKFPNLYYYRTIGWEWKFGTLNLESMIVPQDLICSILKHFIANAVVSEAKDLRVKLDIYKNLLRITDSNPGGSGLSEALLADRRMIIAFQSCEKKLEKYLEIERNDEFKDYVRNLCHIIPDCSPIDILEIIYKLHRKWVG